MKKKILLIDNFDSFTYNLKQVLVENGAEVDVVRNNKIPFSDLDDYDGIVLSPGPSVPDNAGDLKKLIQTVKEDKAILGICLGMQAIGEVFGARLNLLDKPLHGISREINHNGHDIFENTPTRMETGRYHSWVIDGQGNQNIEILASDDEEEIMAIKVKNRPVFGFQFHPESILTPDGPQLINNFLSYCNA